MGTAANFSDSFFDDAKCMEASTPSVFLAFRPLTRDHIEGGGMMPIVRAGKYKDDNICEVDLSRLHTLSCRGVVARRHGYSDLL